MKLNRAERDNYVVTYSTDPPLSGTVEASFDDGKTWHDGTPNAGGWAWLVAGPDFDAATLTPPMDPNDTVATIEGSTTPLLRLKDDPIVDVAKGPGIRLWG